MASVITKVLFLSDYFYHEHLSCEQTVRLTHSPISVFSILLLGDPHDFVFV